MAAATTDKFDRTTDSSTGRPVIAKLAAGKNIGDLSITLTDTTNWTTTTKIHFAIYNLTTAGYKDVTSQTDWSGTLPASSTTISNLTLTGGTDQQYTTDAYVELTPTSGWTKDLYDGLAIAHNNDGTLKQAAVKTALGITSNATGGWDILNGGTAPTTTSGYNLGNKQFKLTFANVDLSSTLSAGMRFKVDRNTTPPSKCFQFTSSSSQYATKSSPSGITFTDTFTVEAWVYLNSYQDNTILSRYDGTNGWRLSINPQGQVFIQGLASSVNVARSTWNAIPLGAWTHVAATLSMSTGNTTLYIDGAGQTIQYVSTSGTALSQGTGPLQMGAYNGTNFFNGYMSEVRLWSSVQTATQIGDNMCINLTGTETNLIGLWQGGTNFNDADSNANNLTAQNSATATATGNPFSTTEQGLITDVTYSSPNTTVVVTGGPSNDLIPLATMINPYSSYQTAPVGWHGIKWEWTTLLCTSFSSSGTALTTVWAFQNNVYLPTLNGRTTEASIGCRDIFTATSGIFDVTLWKGTVGSGIQCGGVEPNIATGVGLPLSVTFPLGRQSAGETYFAVGLKGSAGAATMEASTVAPGYLTIRVRQG